MTPTRSPRPVTYDAFVLHTLFPAIGWQAVYWIEGAHQVFPIYALALATRRTREAHTARLVPAFVGEVEEEQREVVGLEYAPCDGWGICDQVGNYCGLLPPDWTLEQFVANRECDHPMSTEAV